MKFNWKEMTPAQKRDALVSIILPLLALPFLVLDITGKWPNNITFFFLSALSLYEGIVGWNKNRKMAILEFVLVVVFAAVGFIG